jgi:hypothetical protein
MGRMNYSVEYEIVYFVTDQCVYLISAPPPTPRPSEESVQPTVILITTGTIVAVILVAVFVKKRYCDGEIIRNCNIIVVKKFYCVRIFTVLPMLHATHVQRAR